MRKRVVHRRARGDSGQILSRKRGEHRFQGRVDEVRLTSPVRQQQMLRPRTLLLRRAIYQRPEGSDAHGGRRERAPQVLKLSGA